jgi:hypothetical protein
VKDIPRPDFIFSLDRPAKLNDLLPKADVVVLACPLTNETRGLLGRTQFQAMKKTAYMINVARGGVVDTPALVEALEQGRIAGAGLDVIDPEPLPKGHPLWKSPNVVISPHIGGQSAGGQRSAGFLEIVLRKVLALAGSIGPAGMQDVDANLVRQELNPGCSGHLVLGGLRHVVRHAARERDVSVRRTHDHDIAALPLPNHLVGGGTQRTALVMRASISSRPSSGRAA